MTDFFYQAPAPNPHTTGCDVCSKSTLDPPARFRCSGCKIARYCSAACQQADWGKHKPTCAFLQSANPVGFSIECDASKLKLFGDDISPLVVKALSARPFVTDWSKEKIPVCVIWTKDSRHGQDVEKNKDYCRAKLRFADGMLIGVVSAEEGMLPGLTKSQIVSDDKGSMAHMHTAEEFSKFPCMDEDVRKAVDKIAALTVPRMVIIVTCQAGGMHTVAAGLFADKGSCHKAQCALCHREMPNKAQTHKS